MPDRDAIRNRLLALIAVLLVVAGLKWSAPFSMPVAVAIFIVASAWPIKARLDKALPAPLSTIGTVLALLLILAAFVGAIYVSAVQAVAAFTRNQDRFHALYQGATSWLQDRGISGLGELWDRLVALAGTIIPTVYAGLGYLLLIAVLVILGLPEAPALRRKLHGRLDREDRQELIEAVERIAENFRQYIGLTTLTSLITGASCALWAFVMGLDLTLVWGVLNFVLNYIPVIGNIVGILPPTLYAMIQFESRTATIVTFLGFAAIQFVISNFVYPMLQGRGLSLSPAAIIVALAFWSWVWGLAGALIAVPMTAAVVIACRHFRSTGWVSDLLSGRD